VPAATTFHAQRRAFDRRAALIRAEIQSLSRLDPPGELDASLRGLVAAIRDELAAAEDLRVASLTSDIESAEGAVYRGMKAAQRASAFARRLGLRVCARPPRTP
jgi:hypothetical protein